MNLIIGLCAISIKVKKVQSVKLLTLKTYHIWKMECLCLMIYSKTHESTEYKRYMLYFESQTLGE